MVVGDSPLTFDSLRSNPQGSDGVSLSNSSPTEDSSPQLNVSNHVPAAVNSAAKKTRGSPNHRTDSKPESSFHRNSVCCERSPFRPKTADTHSKEEEYAEAEAEEATSKPNRWAVGRRLVRQHLRPLCRCVDAPKVLLVAAILASARFAEVSLRTVVSPEALMSANGVDCALRGLRSDVDAVNKFLEEMTTSRMNDFSEWQRKEEEKDLSLLQRFVDFVNKGS